MLLKFIQYAQKAGSVFLEETTYHGYIKLIPALLLVERTK
jgi:hypothetical protein